MKLGGYGCFRIAMFLMPDALDVWAPVFLVLTTISVVYGALSACVQTDLKYINAYSSVSHCGMVLFALLMTTQTAITGAVLQMLSHGLMTALFFAVIGMIYHRAGTRDVRYLGGLMQVVPFLSVGYVIAGLANLGLPGFSGFVAEMNIFVGSFENADTFVHAQSLPVRQLSSLPSTFFVLSARFSSRKWLTPSSLTCTMPHGTSALPLSVSSLALLVSDLLRFGHRISSTMPLRLSSGTSENMPHLRQSDIEIPSSYCRSQGYVSRTGGNAGQDKQQLS